MSNAVDLYDTSYGHYAARLYEGVRKETYGEDIGQTSWMTVDEFRRIFTMLELTPASQVLEIGCGAGACAAYMVESVGCHVIGVDVNKNGVRNASELVRTRKLDSRLRFERADAGQRLPFADQSFDAVVSNDAMCHIPRRLAVLKEWYRVLRPGGRALYTDAMIVTGALSNEEMAARSSIGYYLFLPPGENERLIREAGLELLRADDVTEAAAVLSKRWRDARALRQSELVKVEGEANFDGLQTFLACVHNVARERRLSRFLYLARKREGVWRRQ